MVLPHTQGLLQPGDQEAVRRQAFCGLYLAVWSKVCFSGHGVPISLASTAFQC